MELEGAAEAVDVRVSEAFWGRNSELEEDGAAWASLRAFRLRWGRSSSVAELGEGGFAAEVGGRGQIGSAVFVDAFGASFPLIDPESATVDVIALLLPPTRTPSSKVFGEKYPAHNRGVVPAIEALTVDALENFLLVTDRLDFPAVSRRQDRHTVLRPLNLQALAGGYRIIIACRCCEHKKSDHILRFPAGGPTQFGLRPQFLQLRLGQSYYGLLYPFLETKEAQFSTQVRANKDLTADIANLNFAQVPTQRVKLGRVM